MYPLLTRMQAVTQPPEISVVKIKNKLEKEIMSEGRLSSLSAVVLESVIHHLSEEECNKLKAAIKTRTRQLKCDTFFLSHQQRVQPLLELDSDFQEELHFLLHDGFQVCGEFPFLHSEMYVKIENVLYRLPAKPERVGGLPVNLWVTVYDPEMVNPRPFRVLADGKYYRCGLGMEDWTPPHRLLDFVTFIWEHGFYCK